MAKKKNEEAIALENKDDSLYEYFRKELHTKEFESVEEFISTGSTLLDYCIANKANGGIPVGRITEICGKEATGKSLIAYHILANTQKRGGIAVYIDTERAGNKEFMERMGVDCNKLIYERKLTYIEEVFGYMEKVITLARLKIPDKSRPLVIVWDSVAATPAKTVLEGEYDSQRPGVEAKAMSQSLKKVLSALDEGRVTLVCINQVREKIGIAYGDPDVTPHGKALPFYASVRIKMTGSKKIAEKASNRVVGVAATARVFKNKVAPNHREACFPLHYDWGVNNEQSVLDHLCDIGAIDQGAWKTITINGEAKKFQSSDWKTMLESPEVRKFVTDTLEDKMVVKFSREAETIDFNEESALEVESLQIMKSAES